MPASATLIHSSNSTAGASNYAVGSFNITSGELYYAVVVNTRGATVGTVNSLSASGPLEFVEIGNVAAADGLARITLMRGTASATQAVNPTLAFNGGNQNGALWMIFHIEGADPTSDGVNTFLQFTSDEGLAEASASLSMAAFSSGLNGVFAAFMSRAGVAGTTFTPETDYSELGEESYDGPVTRCCAIFRDDNDLTPGVSMTSSDWLGVAVELVSNTGVAEFSVGGTGVALSHESAADIAIAS